MKKQEMKLHWDLLWRRLCARSTEPFIANTQQNPDPVYALISTHYSEPHRAYHTLRHIAHCLRTFYANCETFELRNIELSGRREDVLAVEFALWFHDVIYDTHAKNNEKRSADLAVSILQWLKLPAHFIEKVHRCIMATTHTSVPSKADEQLTVDLDLAGFALPFKQFDENIKRVRQEFIWVPEDEFRKKHSAVLRMFLERPHIYSTKTFREKYEIKARENLERAIAKLDGANI